MNEQNPVQQKELPPLACDDCCVKNTKRDYVQIGAIFLILLALYLIAKQFDLLPKGLGISNSMNIGFVFLIGLVAAATTCMAVTGGFVLAVAAKFNERNPDLSGFQKFKPHLSFNIGRMLSYTVLGGGIGALGKAFTFSPRIMGGITILVSLVMILLGFQLLRIFPSFRKFQFKMPKIFSEKIRTAGKTGKIGPFLLGASTFFFPCGFTQALQLYVLSQGDIMNGMLVMLFFSLGTLPGLLAVGALSSFAKGSFQRYFLKFAGVLVILLGFFNINNGLVLAGTNFNFASILQTKAEIISLNQSADSNVKFMNGKQVVNMKIKGLNYFPHRFTIEQGIPVEWRIDGAEAVGCAQVITVPKLGITEFLSPSGLTTISFLPREIGEIRFSCTMGMTTRGSSFTVIPRKTCSSEFADCVTG